MNEEIKKKIEKGEVLTAGEQKEFMAAFNGDFERLKQNNPQKYLEFITELNKIVSDLNKELREAKAQLKV